jgi:hypothetical protein
VSSAGTKPWLDSDFQRDVRRLARSARASARQVPPVRQLSPLSSMVARSSVGTPFYVLEGEALPLLRSLQRRLAGSSRVASGLSPDEARALLLELCDEAVRATIKGAVAAFVAEVEAPSSEWVIVEPVQAFLPPGRLIVGRTTYSDRPPRRAGRHLEFARQQGFEPPFASARVTARGFATAQVLARIHFAESGAILDLASRPNQVGSETTFWRQPGGSGRFNFHRSGSILIESEGTRLVPPYRQLAGAAARDEARRSDWERRLLAATRWFSRSHRSAWPADRLASAMVALECLFVQGMSERGRKGALIAERLTERFSLREMTQADLDAWLRRLYVARNDAVHEGRDFVDDLDVDRLLDLTRYVIQSFAVHLIPAHRANGRSCRTFEQAMRCTRP